MGNLESETRFELLATSAVHWRGVSGTWVTCVDFNPTNRKKRKGAEARSPQRNNNHRTAPKAALAQ